MGMLNQKKVKALYALTVLLGLIYLPIYLTSWLLRLVARFALSISYFGMLEGKMGCDVFKSLFKFYDHRV